MEVDAFDFDALEIDSVAGGGGGRRQKKQKKRTRRQREREGSGGSRRRRRRREADGEEAEEADEEEEDEEEGGEGEGEEGEPDYTEHPFDEDAWRFKREPLTDATCSYIAKDQPYCYICETIEDASNEKRAFIVQTLQNLYGQVATRLLCVIVARYHNRAIQPTTGKMWTDWAVFEHLMSHVKDVKRHITHDLNELWLIQCQYEKRLNRKDTQGNSMTPDPFLLKEYLNVIRDKHRTLRFHDSIQK